MALLQLRLIKLIKEKIMQDKSIKVVSIKEMLKLGVDKDELLSI